MKRQFIQSSIEISDTARIRRKCGTKPKENTIKYSYSINKNKIMICQKMFLQTLCISNTVVVNTVNN